MKLVTALLTLVVFVLSGTVGLAAEGNYTIVYSTKNIINPAFNGAWRTAQKAAEEYRGRVNLIFSAPTRPDNIADQTSQMEDLILKRPDGIVFQPVDYVAMVPVVKKMNAAGIPVFAYNNEPAGGKYEIYIGSDDVTMAYKVGKYGLDSIGKKGKAIILDGVPGAITAQNRHKGFVNALEGSGWELLTSQPADYNRMKGMQVMENLLQRYPQIDVVLCSNDEMAMGAIEAIDAAGRMKATKVVGIDANPDSSKSIQEGRLFASIDGAIWIQSYLAVHAAVKYLDGKKIPKEIITENTVVTKDNASAFVIPYGERALPTWDDTMKWTGVKW